MNSTVEPYWPRTLFRHERAVETPTSYPERDGVLRESKRLIGKK